MGSEGAEANWKLEPISVDDREPVLRIFNYYVEKEQLCGVPRRQGP
jgi:hypothetical protein